MKLSEKLKYWRTTSPEDWQMDFFTKEAELLEKENKLLREALINEIENESTQSLEAINKYIDEIVLEGE